MANFILRLYCFCNALSNYFPIMVTVLIPLYWRKQSHESKFLIYNSFQKPLKPKVIIWVAWRMRQASTAAVNILSKDTVCLNRFVALHYLLHVCHVLCFAHFFLRLFLGLKWLQTPLFKRPSERKCQDQKYQYFSISLTISTIEWEKWL